MLIAVRVPLRVGCAFSSFVATNDGIYSSARPAYLLIWRANSANYELDARPGRESEVKAGRSGRALHLRIESLPRYAHVAYFRRENVEFLMDR